MPELPEVEIVKEGLKKILGPDSRITNIRFLRKNLRQFLPHKQISKVLSLPIKSIERRAKYIFIYIGDESVIVSHLGMSGAWRLEKNIKQLKVHDHIILELKSKENLIYNDPRRFGMFDILSRSQFLKDKRFKDLGPEPLSDDFNLNYFFTKSQRKKTHIKSFIMDQKVVVGVGNIYACEALYQAQVSPFLEAGQLTKVHQERLIRSIKSILKQSIELGGSTISDYMHVDEEVGSYQNNHQVYGRKGKPCHKCSAQIDATVIAGRSTFWCVKCQKTPRKIWNELKKRNLKTKSVSATSRIARSRRKYTKT